MKVESYKIIGWEKEETGLFISENDNWILVHHVPVDYVLDGFKIYRKKFISERISREPEKKIERVLLLKDIKPFLPFNFKFGTALEILKWSEQEFGLFEFQDGDENELFYGKMHLNTDINFKIDMIDSEGIIDSDFDITFDSNEIRSISFSIDYFESIRLLFLDNLSGNKFS